MKPTILALSAALLAVSALAGCGQKAPLYLPGHNPNPPKPLVPPAKGKQPQSGAGRPGNTPDASGAPSSSSSNGS